MIILIADDVDYDGDAQKWYQNAILLIKLKVMTFFMIFNNIYTNLK